MPNWINFAELRARVSLEDVIVRYYKIDNLKRDGQKLVGPCPVHGGDSPRAFHVDLEKNVWHCFSKCQRGGNQIDFVSLKENIGVREAALRLQAFFLEGTGPAPTASASTPAPKATPTPAATPTTPPATPKPEHLKENEDDNPILDVKLDLKGDHPHLIEDRRLKLETTKHFGVGYCSRGIMRGLITIPIHEAEGNLVAYAGRRLKPADIREFGKYKLPKGFKKERVLYNYHRAREHAAEGLILVEGFFSVLKLHEAGFQNVVAAMGCEVSDHQAAILARAVEVIVLFDGDAAGRIGADAARAKLAPHTKVRIVRLPEGKEPDDLPQRALRWIVNGMKALNLAEVAFAFHGDATQASSDTPTN